MAPLGEAWTLPVPQLRAWIEADRKRRAPSERPPVLPFRSLSPCVTVATGDPEHRRRVIGPDTGDTTGRPRRYGQRASAWMFTGRRWKASGPRCPA